MFKFSNILKLNLFRYIRNNRGYTKTATGALGLVDKVVLTDDNNTFVAWHPRQEFPYELSRPIPLTKVDDSGSLLKEQVIQTATRAFKEKRPEIVVEELQKATFTTKHRWYPRARDKKAKNTPMDREYL